MALPNFPNNPTLGQQFTVANSTYECIAVASGTAKPVWKVVNQADKGLRAELASTGSSVAIAGIPAKLFRQFVIIQPIVGDAGAQFNALIAEGITNIFCVAGDYVFNTSLTTNARLKILGVGKSLTKFKRGASLGTANIITGTGHDLEIEGVGFDLGKGSYTPNLSNAQLENAINSVSPVRLKVTNCDFSNLVNYGIVVNGTSLNEAKDIDISANTGTTGTRGFVMVRRYGKNVHVDRNNITDMVDVANTLFKPIEVSGSLDVSICDNVITQTNSAGGPVIVEYIDRESVNVSIQRNHYYGPAGEAYFKVGAASNVWFTDNHTSGLADIGAYFEGCENLWICNNRLVNTRRNSLVLAQDFDTSRYNKKVKVLNNHFVDANRDNASVGVPYTSTGSNNSYCAWVQDNTEQVEFKGNHYIKGTNECGGLLISSPSYVIKEEDFSKLGTNAVTINNSFAPAGAEYEISNNIKCATSAKGEVTINSGTASALIDPPIVKHYWPNTTVTLKTVLSGAAAYVIAEGDVPPKVAVIAKTAAHANVTLSANATLFWNIDCSKAVKGILGKTI